MLSIFLICVWGISRHSQASSQISSLQLVPGLPQWEAPRRRQMALFDAPFPSTRRNCASTLKFPPDDGAPGPLPEMQSGPPVEETHYGCLCPRPKTVFTKTVLLLDPHQYAWRSTAPCYRHKKPRYSFSWGRYFASTRREQRILNMWEADHLNALKQLKAF